MPRFDEVFSEAELEAIDAKVKKSLPKKGLAFAVPWNVQAFEPEARDELIRTAPWILRLLYRIHAPRFARLVDAAFAGVPEPRLD